MPILSFVILTAQCFDWGCNSLKWSLFGAVMPCCMAISFSEHWWNAKLECAHLWGKTLGCQQCHCGEFEVVTSRNETRSSDMR